MAGPAAEARREALIQAGVTLASELSLPSVLQKIVKLACDVADARYGALGVIGRGGGIQEFITHGVTEDERRAIGHIPVGKGILGVLITDAEPLRLERISDDPRSVGFPPNHPPMTSFLGVPIRVRDRVYGNLYLTEKRGAEEFTKEDERDVSTLATQAAVAIENARLYEEGRRQRDRLEAAAEVTAAILEARPLDDVLTLITRFARRLLEADLAALAVPAGSGRLTIRAADGPATETLLGTTFDEAGSISGDVIRSGRPEIVEDASSDPRIHQPIVRLGHIGSLVVLPLAAGERSFGTLAVGTRAGRRQLDEDDVTASLAFAAQAAVALDYAQIREELQRLAVLEDRERIGKELHDGAVQSLFAVGMALQATESLADDAEVVRRRLRESTGAIDEVIRDLRNYIFGLGPGRAADRELDRALRDLVEGLRRGSDVAIRVEIDPRAASALTAQSAHVVQATREALSNAIRHGAPQTLSLTVASVDDEVVLEVEDDGIGFDVQAVSGPGRGLHNLRTRAESLGGRLELRSAPGEGTTVRLRIPRP